MGSSTGHIFTLANSIIGVSVLAMPYCFKQCGIFLSALSLILSNLLTRLACHYLMKSAIMERMKNFEMLAFRAFGPHGKFTVEICIIGFMLGTCVAYFVIVGDLGPAIIGPALGLEHVTALRPSVLIGVAIFVVLPLGLKRNVDSLNGLCAASIAFYLVLVLKVISEAGMTLLSGTWLDTVDWWRPAGLLQCLPIFSMALSCQTQLFEIFGSLPNTPLERANAVVKSAVNLTTTFYLSVGFFGYVAYSAQRFTGNLMLNFSPTVTSELIKMGFILSVAVSFPLVIFPCRASIYSLLYSKNVPHTHHNYEPLGSAHIPETQFQCITLLIVTGSLIIGLLIPNIEIVLGLVGSTIGVFVCLITPGLIFISLSSKKNNERLTAQCLIGFGVTIMVLGTYANLYATEETLLSPDVPKFDPVVNHEEKAPLPLLKVKDLINDAQDNPVRSEMLVKDRIKKPVDPIKLAESDAKKEEQSKVSPEKDDKQERWRESVHLAQPAELKKEQKKVKVPPSPAQPTIKKNEESSKKDEPLKKTVESNVKPQPDVAPVKLGLDKKSHIAQDAGQPQQGGNGKSAGAKIDEVPPRVQSQGKSNLNAQNKLAQKMAENVPLPLALARIVEAVNKTMVKGKSPQEPPKEVDQKPVPPQPSAPPLPSQKKSSPAVDSPSAPDNVVKPLESEVRHKPQGIAVNNRDILEVREKRDADACEKNGRDQVEATTASSRPDALPSSATIIKTPRTLSNGEAELDLNLENIDAAVDASSRLQNAEVDAALQDQPHKRDLKSLEKQE